MSCAMVRTTIRNILAALDFLHTEAGVIHTGRCFYSILKASHRSEKLKTQKIIIRPATE
jgi:hypothetical protein